MFMCCQQQNPNKFEQIGIMIRYEYTNVTDMNIPM